jgi:hypothetical protein
MITVYLWTPAIIFAIGWLRPIPCLLSLAGLLLLTGRAAVKAVTGLHWRNLRRDAPALGVLAVLALVWVVLSGCGGWAHQNGDYFKHNGVLGDLIHRTWPVSYTPAENASAPGSLIYYVAYYLPAAAVGKWLGHSAGQNFIVFWTWLGVLLSLCAFSTAVSDDRSTRRQVLSGLFFIVASGADALGTYLASGAFPALGVHIEWWATIGEYASNTTSLYWVPQHALAGWLAASVVLADGDERRSFVCTLEVAAGTLLWSPFVSLGLLPFVLVRWLRLPKRLDFRMVLEVGLLAGWCGIVACFLMAGRSKLPLHWLFTQESYSLLRLLGFYLLEFGLLALVIHSCPEVRRRSYWCFITTLLSLAVWPVVTLGAANDLMMRSSIPALFCLWVFVGRALFSATIPHLERRVLEWLVLAGSITAISEMARGLQNPQPERYVVNEYTSVMQMAHADTLQYVGKPRHAVNGWLFK